jgi:hypothetical protein
MTIDDGDEKVHLIDAESSTFRVFICVGIDPRPLMCHIGPTRVAATVIVAIGRNDDRIAHSLLIVHHQCTHA